MMGKLGRITEGWYGLLKVFGTGAEAKASQR